VVVYTRDAPLLGRRFVLVESPILVGRAADNHIVLPDASVSLRHAHLEERDSAWWCVDDASTDGVYIDDQLSTAPAPLVRGTRVGIGSTIFKFLSGSRLEEDYHEEIYRLTVYDGLTRAYVRRHLVEQLDKEIMRARRVGRVDGAFALLMIDVDEAATDAGVEGPSTRREHVVREVAGLLRGFLPDKGMLARYGAARFVMVLPERTIETASAFAESLREKVASSRLQVGPRELQATVCIGASSLQGEDRGSKGVLERAGRALDVANSQRQSQRPK
jgi:diguanylate cyclase (GGDEF)-like protein